MRRKPKQAPDAEFSEPAGPAATRSSANGRALLGASVKVHGDLDTGEDIEIQGRVDGRIRAAEHTVTVTEDGHVRADIRARAVVVHGRVTGEIEGIEQVLVGPSGRVDGNVAAPRVGLESGASVNGKIHMGESARSTKLPGAGGEARPASGNA